MNRKQKRSQHPTACFKVTSPGTSHFLLGPTYKVSTPSQWCHAEDQTLAYVRMFQIHATAANNEFSPIFQKTNIKELNALGKKESLSFTFLKQEAGSYFTLESAANRGYFIFTYNTPSQPVGVTKEIGKEKNTHFSFEAANVDLKEVKS